MAQNHVKTCKNHVKTNENHVKTSLGGATLGPSVLRGDRFILRPGLLVGARVALAGGDSNFVAYFASRTCRIEEKKW